MRTRHLSAFKMGMIFAAISAIFLVPARDVSAQRVDPMLGHGPSAGWYRDWAAPPRGDAVLAWNAVLLQANANDFDPAVVAHPDQKGPVRTARAFAIVHAAIFDAVNSIHGAYTPYLGSVPASHGASVEAAVSQAAHDTLAALYPKQRSFFDAGLALSLKNLPPGRAKLGSAVGAAVASRLLHSRADDGSQAPQSYTPIGLPGYHQPDPLHPLQGFLDPEWGNVRPFTMSSSVQFPAPTFVGMTPEDRLAWLNSDAYTEAFHEVKTLGGKQSTVRTADQMEIGIFWSYDGTPQLGTPPRLYNQIARVIAARMGNSLVENSRFFALINLAQGDAGIACWGCKYTYNFWRPIVGIREAAETGNPATAADPNWVPFGAQADNGSGSDFTPNFPSFGSGHATFGSAVFQVMRRYYDTDRIHFAFQSDEFNGVTRDDTGAVRPRRTRVYRSLSQAEMENHDSRIYLGVHWRFDQDAGMAMGRQIGDYVFENALLPR